MKPNPTPLVRLWLDRRVRDMDAARRDIGAVQRAVLSGLMRCGAATRFGASRGLRAEGGYDELLRAIPVPMTYAELRPMVMRMVDGEPDVLWPGVTRRFAQSSGTSDGKSKYVPVTDISLRICHYRGAASAVASYVHRHRDSRLFAGKSFILGGSFANALELNPGVKVGDLSAHLIDHINPLANLVRVPSKEIALMPDWTRKLPRLVEAAAREDVTNISGVPSWFLTVLLEVMKLRGVSSIHDVWPNLEVFFHGGISMAPYRAQYAAITAPGMRYVETYNASEGFFAVQTDPTAPGMELMCDCGIFYEFIPLAETDSARPRALPAWEVAPGEVYELVITACNGLWRYRLGDTVRVESLSPLTVTVAGRTRCFINAFGEELMVHNAEAAMARVCAEMGCEVADYTAAPVYADQGHRGRHEWLIEFRVPPADPALFAARLDQALQQENSDYEAKRAGGIFLDPLTVVPGTPGVFTRWLASTGKLGGQRKVPRLSNSRDIIDSVLRFNHA